MDHKCLGMEARHTSTLHRKHGQQGEASGGGNVHAQCTSANESSGYAQAVNHGLVQSFEKDSSAESNFLDTLQSNGSCVKRKLDKQGMDF